MLNKLGIVPIFAIFQDQNFRIAWQQAGHGLAHEAMAFVGQQPGKRIGQTNIVLRRWPVLDEAIDQLSPPTVPTPIQQRLHHSQTV